MNLEILKSKYEKFINHESAEEIEKQLLNQDNMCYICCGDLESNIIKTKCGHFYHYDCLKISIMNTKLSYYEKQECPYCRSNAGWLPLLGDQEPIRNVHKEYTFKPSMNKKCVAIIKSGKKKGMICGCKIKMGSENENLCGRHKNYVIPKVENKESLEKEMQEYKENWYKNKILNCY